MKKLSTFVRTFIQSCTSPDYYADVFKVKFSFSLKYFLFLTFLFAVVTTARVLIPVTTFDVNATAAKITMMYPADLVINVGRGRLAINQPLPYAIPFPQMGNRPQPQPMMRPRAPMNPMNQNITNLVVFDSDTNVQGITSFYSYHTLALITESTIYTQSNQANGEVKAYPIPADMAPMTINAAQIATLRDHILRAPLVAYKLYVPAIGVLLFVVILAASTLGGLIKLFFYSIVIAIFAWILRSVLLSGQKFSFGKIYQISLHTITLSLVLKQILAWVSWGRSFNSLSFVIYLIWTFVALKAIADQNQNVSQVRRVVAVSAKPTKKKAKRS